MYALIAKGNALIVVDELGKLLGTGQRVSGGYGSAQTEREYLRLFAERISEFVIDFFNGNAGKTVVSLTVAKS